MSDVSVIIPTFNRLWCLPRAVESCRNTTCRTEIIVVDDGSVDGTWEWLEAQPDIVALRQPNQGQTWAVNLGFARANGRFIRFLDSDDFLTAGFIDAQFDMAVSSGADVVYSRVDLFDEGTGKVTTFDDPSWDDFMAAQLGEGYGGHFLGMLFSRRVIPAPPRRPEFSDRDDRLFLLEVALRNPKLAVVPGCCGYWTQHASQMQRNYRGLQSVSTHWQHLNIYWRILGELDRRGDLNLRRRRAASQVLWRLAHWIAYTHLEEACGVSDWIRTLDPAFVAPETGLLGLLYRHLGFRRTEILLRLRRLLVAPTRRQPGSRGADVPSAGSPRERTKEFVTLPS